MNPILQKALTIAAILEDLADEDASIEQIIERVQEDDPSVSAPDVIEYLSFFKQLAPYLLTAKPDEQSSQPIDLEKELKWLYRAAKKQLAVNSDKDSLNMCIKAIDTIVKLQERVRNQAYIEEFEQRILSVIDKLPSEAKDLFLAELQKNEQ